MKEIKVITYFQTISAKRVSVSNPKVKDICIEDIATGLANLCRFAGQLPLIYSVAAHSIEVSYWIENNGGTVKEALSGLLHDASEAYCADVPSPYKAKCKDYQRLETKLQKAIAKRFGLEYPFPKIVHQADKAVLFGEKLMQFGLPKQMQARNVKQLFLNRFKELGGKE